MGYGRYALRDGREGGYLVAAECDREGCRERIDRGLGFLCGESPDTGGRDPDEPGCARYFCDRHLDDHDCPAPECGVYPPDGEEAEEPCGLIAGHAGPHQEDTGPATFTLPEIDDA